METNYRIDITHDVDNKVLDACCYFIKFTENNNYN